MINMIIADVDSRSFGDLLAKAMIQMTLGNFDQSVLFDINGQTVDIGGGVEQTSDMVQSFNFRGDHSYPPSFCFDPV